MHGSEYTASVMPPPQNDLQKEMEVIQDHSSQRQRAHQLNSEAMSSYPFILAFNNLTYSVKTHLKRTCIPLAFRFGNADKAAYEEKLLLNDISGEAKEGQIMAVLGASGAGKSTLIDALAGRISKDSLKGSVTLNGQELLGSNTSILKSISAYVMQNDTFFPMLTVEETLMFSAELRLPRMLSKSKKRERVQKLIDQLGLRDASNTMIGDDGHPGVSGGEKRRVSIGVGIISDPIILFLDEPTSGLDSCNAFLVVNVLKAIALNGSIVILSVHQPSSRILSLMSQLIILSNGQMVYSGSPSELTQFFAACNHPIPDDVNRAEFALDLISELEESSRGITSLVDSNKSWRMRKTTQDRSISLLSASLKDELKARTSVVKLLTCNPFWVEIYVIGKRTLINSKRMPESFGFQFGAVFLSGVMLATIFWRLDDSPKGAQEKLAFFASAMTISFFISAEAIPKLIQEKNIFTKERACNTYRTSSYVLSHSLTGLPSLIILSLTFSALTFWAVGLGGRSAGFLWFFLFMLSSFWSGRAFVTFVSSVVPHIMIGYVVVVTLLAQFMLFGGFFIPRDRIPPYWVWFHYLSVVKYPYQGVMLNEFDDPLKCFVNGIQMFDNTPLQSASEALKVNVLGNMGRILGTNMTNLCVMTGSDVLQQQGVTDLSKLDCLWITIAWGFLFRILFNVALLLVRG